MNKTLVVTEDCNGQRIDKYIVDHVDDISRTHIQKLLKSDEILVNHKPCKPNYKVSTNDVIFIKIQAAKDTDIKAEDIFLDIVYEDDDLIIVNKPKGMVVHPAPGHLNGTLVNALMYHCKDNLSGINGVLRPGIVHRIDKDTTGLLIVCKNDFAHNHIAMQLKEHSITRKYIAIVNGVIKESSGTINAPIGRHITDRKKMSIHTKNGKDAITHYKVIKTYLKYTYIECQLETGRTHQIRVHMASINHPLLGDAVYNPHSSPFQLEGQVLHAKTIGFYHPRTGQYLEFEAPIPEYFEKLLNNI